MKPIYAFSVAALFLAMNTPVLALDAISTTYVSDSQVDTTSYSYKMPGIVQSVTQPDGRVQNITQFNYAGQAQDILDTAADNTTRTSHVFYNPDGNVLQVIGPDSAVSNGTAEGSVTTYHYNGFGDRLTETAPEMGTLTMTRDAMGNPLTIQDSKGNVTTITYDALNRPSSKIVTISTGSVTDTYTYAYDGALKGYPDSVQNQTATLLWTWATTGELNSLTEKIGSSLTLQTSWSYDPTGRPTQQTLPSGNQVNIGYDSASQLLSALTLNNPATQTSQTILQSVRYQPFGNVQGWTWGNNNTHLKQLDMSGRPSQLLDRYAEQLQYTSVGQINQRSDLNPSSQLSPVGSGNQYAYGYDGFNRLNQVGVNSSTTQNITWDTRDNRQDTNTTFNTPYQGYPTQQWLQEKGQTATYDANGNLIGLGARSYGYNASNQLTDVSDSGTIEGQYSYGPNGFRVKKVTNGTSRYFFYLPGGQLLGEYELTSSGAKRVIQEHVYLAGEPVAVLDGPSNSSNGVTPVWILTSEASQNISDLESQENQEKATADSVEAKFDTLVQESNDFQAAINKSFIPILMDDILIPIKLKVTYQYDSSVIQSAEQILHDSYLNLGLDTQLAQMVATSTSTSTPMDVSTLQSMKSQVATTSQQRIQQIEASITQWQSTGTSVIPLTLHYVHDDALGTPRKITRASDNALVWSLAPDDPWGTNQPDSTSTLTYNLRFPGQYYDQETGLNENRNRFYDPKTGRYLQPDPIGLAGGMHRYAYVVGDPVNRVDPLGLLPDPLDVGNALLDAGSLASNFSGGEYGAAALDAGALTLDVGSALFSPIPGTSQAGSFLRGYRAFKKAERAAEACKATAREIGILKDAARGKGNFGLGEATYEQANRLGLAWVGEGATLASDGRTLVSADRLRTYRPPSPKNSPYASTGVQANFEQLEIVKGKPKIIGNGHLDITP